MVMVRLLARQRGYLQRMGTEIQGLLVPLSLSLSFVYVFADTGSVLMPCCPHGSLWTEPAAAQLAPALVLFRENSAHKVTGMT